jgi:hypothetical protein
MAIVVLGGLLSAVLLNMLVVPALYLRYGAETSRKDTPLVMKAEAARVLDPVTSL